MRLRCHVSDIYKPTFWVSEKLTEMSGQIPPPSLIKSFPHTSLITRIQISTTQQHIMSTWAIKKQQQPLFFSSLQSLVVFWSQSNQLVLLDFTVWWISSSLSTSHFSFVREVSEAKQKWMWISGLLEFTQLNSFQLSKLPDWTILVNTSNFSTALFGFRVFCFKICEDYGFLR
mgnify:CR=1 FL=1